MNTTLSKFDLTEIGSAAEEILSLVAPNILIFLFYGEMGAGKTTLIKELCKQLGVKENVTSPTFSIVNEYKADSGSIFHFDFYRLKYQAEALDMGYEEYFYSGNYCFIEWPEKIPDLLPDHFIRIRMEVLNEAARRVVVEQI
jgi:tRNA threonylcarbamoyladenosine biosynthesis protein TsaE